VIHPPLCVVAAVVVTAPITLFALGLIVLANMRPLHLPLTESELVNFVARLQAIGDERDGRNLPTP
jgi:hypothetical protein